MTNFRLRDHPYPYALSGSWLELTDPTAATNAPVEYGDDVSLKDSISVENEAGGKTTYMLLLNKPAAIPASEDAPAVTNVSKIKLIGFDKMPIPDPISHGRMIKNCDIDGTLGYTHTKDQLSPVIVPRGASCQGSGSQSLKTLFSPCTKI